MDDTTPDPYFHRLGDGRYRPTTHVQGAWSLDEQHIAPSIGLLTHAAVADHRSRGGELVPGRLSVDILGVLPVDDVEVSVDVLRPGRTIELLEAVLTHEGRPAARLRAWFTAPGDTADVAGTTFPAIPPVDAMAPWDPTTVWAGGFIASAEVRRGHAEPGRAAYWVRSDHPLLDEPVAPTAHAARLFDIANGMATRISPDLLAYPNIDLTAHLFREPAGRWLGFDTVVSFGPGGVGLTSSVLHDVDGPFGTLNQSLTLRPR